MKCNVDVITQQGMFSIKKLVNTFFYIKIKHRMTCRLKFKLLEKNDLLIVRGPISSVLDFPSNDA